MLLSYKPLHLEAQQCVQEEGCVVDIRDLQSLNYYIYDENYDGRNQPVVGWLEGLWYPQPTRVQVLVFAFIPGLVMRIQ